MSFRTTWNDVFAPAFASVLGDSLTISPGVTYPNRNNKTVIVKGKLGDGYVADQGIETTYPIFECSAADAAGIVHGSMVEDGATKYKVVGVQPDGDVMVIIELELQ